MILVKISETNDVIWPGPDNYDYDPKRVKAEEDWDRKISSVPVHAVCNGFVDNIVTSETHRSFSCRRCYMRVTFPREIETFAQLKKHFAQFNPE
jgi:hypothetical protein